MDSHSIVGQVGQWATLLAAIANVLALFAVWYQIRTARRMQEQAASRQLYAEFLKYVAEDPDAVRIEDITPGSKYDWAMYLWITALESGWLAFDGSREWHQRIRSCVRQNPVYFQSDYFQGKGKFANKDVTQDFDAAFLQVFKYAIAEEAHDLSKRSSMDTQSDPSGLAAE